MRNRSRGNVAVLACAAVVVFGCAGCGGDKAREENGAVVREGLPTYAEAAARYNERVAPLERFWARVNVRLTYTDAEGNRKEEQPEGVLQIARPNHLALTLGKAGKTMFWLGCDAERYWWLDLTEVHIAAVGRHEFFDVNGAERIGVAVRPRDLIRLLGIVPMDVSAGGATQWSHDGTLMGISAPIGESRMQRVWVDPASMMPQKIELYGPGRELTVVSDLAGKQAVAMTRPGFSGARPQTAGEVSVTDPTGDARIRLTLTGAKDGPISDDAFRFEVLRQKFTVERLINLDAPPQAE